MHAPMPQSQPPRQATPPSCVSPQQLIHMARAVTGGLSPSPLQQATPAVVGGGGGKEAGRESPYLETQLPQRRSSQPEEAWPMVGEEDLQNKEQLPEHPSSSPPVPPVPAAPQFMYPFSVTEQGLSLMRPPHMATHGPLPGAPTPAGVPVSMQHMFPFMIAPRPFPAHQLQHVAIDTESKEVQTSPYPSPVVAPVMKDKEVDVRPCMMTQTIQCTGVNRRDEKVQTNIKGIGVPLFLPEDIRPPDVSGESMGKLVIWCLQHSFKETRFDLQMYTERLKRSLSMPYRYIHHMYTTPVSTLCMCV